jgi:hypothetical protein
MRQIEVSRTLVLDVPRQARAFFEALVADDLDLGRPDEVKLIFGRRIRKDTPGSFATKVVTRGVEVAVNVFYKHSRIKQYLKEGRALRVETVVNSPTDLGCQRRLANLHQLQAKARAANRRLLTIQRVGQGCAIETALLAQTSQPSLQEGQRTGALRFGDPRVMALAGALAILLNTVVGFTNRSLRAQVSGLLGGAYSSAQVTYDLRRLRLKGLTRRIEHSNRYVLTAEGVRVVVFYTKLYNRLLGPLLAADRPPAHPTSATPCASSTAGSTPTSNTPAWASPHETCLNLQDPSHQGNLVWEASGGTVDANGPGPPRPRSAAQCCADSLLAKPRLIRSLRDRTGHLGRRAPGPARATRAPGWL